MWNTKVHRSGQEPTIDTSVSQNPGRLQLIIMKQINYEHGVTFQLQTIPSSRWSIFNHKNSGHNLCTISCIQTQSQAKPPSWISTVMIPRERSSHPSMEECQFKIKNLGAGPTEKSRLKDFIISLSTHFSHNQEQCVQNKASDAKQSNLPWEMEVNRASKRRMFLILHIK